MQTNWEGYIIYPDLADIRDYEHKTEDLTIYEKQDLSKGIIQSKEKGILEIKFDFESNEDFDGGYIKGFFYPDGKFLGTFYYTKGVNMAKEKFDGTFQKTENGYVSKGILYQESNVRLGYYFTIGTPVLENPVQKVNIIKQKISKPVKASKREKKLKEITPLEKILNDALLARTTRKADQQKKRAFRNEYDVYSHIIKVYGTPNSINNLVLAISIAFSWMPTRVAINVTDKKDLQKMLSAVKKLGTLNSLDDVEKQSPRLLEALTLITTSLDNSIEATSNVLNIFYSGVWPQMNSRVLKGWNIILEKHYSKYPELRLPKKVPSSVEKSVDLYIQYCNLVNVFQKNTRSKSISKVAEPFNWMEI